MSIREDKTSFTNIVGIFNSLEEATGYAYTRAEKENSPSEGWKNSIQVIRVRNNLIKAAYQEINKEES